MKFDVVKLFLIMFVSTSLLSNSKKVDNTFKKSLDVPCINGNCIPSGSINLIENKSKVIQNLPRSKRSESTDKPEYHKDDKDVQQEEDCAKKGNCVPKGTAAKSQNGSKGSRSVVTLTRSKRPYYINECNQVLFLRSESPSSLTDISAKDKKSFTMSMYYLNMLKDNDPKNLEESIPLSLIYPYPSVIQGSGNCLKFDNFKNPKSNITICGSDSSEINEILGVYNFFAKCRGVTCVGSECPKPNTNQSQQSLSSSIVNQSQLNTGSNSQQSCVGPDCYPVPVPCIGTNCNQIYQKPCEGDHCLKPQPCVEPNCNKPQPCELPNCNQNCVGSNCNSNQIVNKNLAHCEGPSCESETRCKGPNCRSYCPDESCPKCNSLECYYIPSPPFCLGLGCVIPSPIVTINSDIQEKTEHTATCIPPFCGTNAIINHMNPLNQFSNQNQQTNECKPPLCYPECPSTCYKNIYNCQDKCYRSPICPTCRPSCGKPDCGWPIICDKPSCTETSQNQNPQQSLIIQDINECGLSAKSLLYFARKRNEMLFNQILSQGLRSLDKSLL